ncbi:TPA: hypothetical protein VBA67_001994 [Streptococcus agalactiae]|nr:hypothetical protein [Streptococcus agalactiae]
MGRAGSNPVVSVVVISATRAEQRAWDMERSYNRFLCRPYGINHVRFVMGL